MNEIRFWPEDFFLDKKEEGCMTVSTMENKKICLTISNDAIILNEHEALDLAKWLANKISLWAEEK